MTVPYHSICIQFVFHYAKKTKNKKSKEGINYVGESQAVETLNFDETSERMIFQSFQTI